MIKKLIRWTLIILASHQSAWTLLSIKMETIVHRVFLEECKYIEKKVIRHIIDDLESFSDGSDQE